MEANGVEPLRHAVRPVAGGALLGLAITLLVLWVGSRRKRRDRAKLDRMRREEMESAAAGLPMEIIDWIPPDADEWKQGS